MKSVAEKREKPLHQNLCSRLCSKPKTVEDVLAIHVKAGWKKGTKLTFPEKGNHEPDAAPEDLIFVIDENPHTYFKSDGNDLIINQKISLLDALTCKTLSFTTLDGRELTIPVKHIVKLGQELSVQNEGIREFPDQFQYQVPNKAYIRTENRSEEGVGKNTGDIKGMLLGLLCTCGFDINSVCIQRAVIDAFNLFWFYNHCCCRVLISEDCF